MQVNQASEVINDLVDANNSNVIFGAVIDPEAADINITLIATGFGSGATFPDSSVSQYLAPNNVRSAAPPQEL